MRYLPILLFCFVTVSQLSAQNPGCDGVRYKDDIFTGIKKTTVQYTTAPSYFFNQTIDLSVDVYEPEGDVLSKRPVVLLAHGGTFIFGNKQDMQDWCERYARKGYVAASIQYRLYPVIPFGFPDSVKIIDAAVKAMSDLKAAFRFFHQDAAGANLFRADTDHIFIGGYSAGAIAALHAAYMDSTDSIEPFVQAALNNNGGFSGNSGNAANLSYPFNPGAVLNMSGGLYRRAWITENSIPLVSMHGTTDGTVAYEAGLAADLIYLEGSGILHPQAASVDMQQVLLTVPGGGHTDIYFSPQYLPQRDSFALLSSVMMESLTCATVAASEPEQQDRSWGLFPNPSFGSVRLDLPQNTDARLLVIQVFDPGGQLVQETRLSGVQLDLGALRRGAYYVRLTDLSRPGLSFPVRTLVKL